MHKSSRKLIKYTYVAVGILLLLYMFNKQAREKVVLSNKESVKTIRVNHELDRDRVCAVILCRIYAEDKAVLTLYHLYQWIMYMRYAGVDHIYLYDAYEREEEKLEASVGFISNEVITYINWSGHAKPYGIDKTQVSAYQHAIDTYGDICAWQIAVDIDEYPTSEKDREAGFIGRYLKKVPESVSEISMQNFLLLGGMNTNENEWLGEKYKRLTLSVGNQLVKPMYRPKRVKAQVHHNTILQGEHREEQADVMRLSHIWGARIDDFSAVMSEHVKEISKEDETLRGIIKKVKGVYVPFRDYI